MTAILRGRFRFTDAPMTRLGLRMRPLTAKELAETKRVRARIRAKLDAAYAQVAELEAECCRMPGNVHRRADLDQARVRLNELRFVWEDAAPEPTHAQRLREYAAKLRKFWERKS